MMVPFNTPVAGGLTSNPISVMGLSDIVSKTRGNQDSDNKTQ